MSIGRGSVRSPTGAECASPLKKGNYDDVKRTRSVQVKKGDTPMMDDPMGLVDPQSPDIKI